MKRTNRTWAVGPRLGVFVSGAENRAEVGGRPGSAARGTGAGRRRRAVVSRGAVGAAKIERAPANQRSASAGRTRLEPGHRRARSGWVAGPRCVYRRSQLCGWDTGRAAAAAARWGEALTPGAPACLAAGALPGPLPIDNGDELLRRGSDLVWTRPPDQSISAAVSLGAGAPARGWATRRADTEPGAPPPPEEPVRRTGTADAPHVAVAGASSWRVPCGRAAAAKRNRCGCYATGARQRRGLGRSAGAQARWRRARLEPPVSGRGPSRPGLVLCGAVAATVVFLTTCQWPARTRSAEAGLHTRWPTRKYQPTDACTDDLTRRLSAAHTSRRP